MSVYAAARKRIGKNTGPASVRAAARRVANTATPSTAIARIRMLSHRPDRTWGKASTKYLPLKKVWRVASHPSELTTTAMRTPATTIVEARETRIDRTVCLRR